MKRIFIYTSCAALNLFFAGMMFREFLFHLEHVELGQYLHPICLLLVMIANIFAGGYSLCQSFKYITLYTLDRLIERFEKEKKSKNDL